PSVLSHRISELGQRLGTDSRDFMEYQSVVRSFELLQPMTETDPENTCERDREKEISKGRLSALADRSMPVLEFIRTNVREFNGSKGAAESFDPLDRLL